MSCKWSWIFLISLDKQINWFNTRADFNMQQFTVGNVDLQVYSMQQFILINNHSNVLIQMNNYDLYIYSYFSWIMQFVVILLIVANVSITHNFN